MSVPCYWINRPQDAERRVKMEAWLDAAELKHRRVDALTPATLPSVQLPREHAGRVTQLELACLASHLEAARLAHADGCRWALILEDDIAAPYAYDWGGLLASAPPGWESLQLHTSHAVAVLELSEVFQERRGLWQPWTSRHHSTGAYVLARAGMEALLGAYGLETARTGSLDLRALVSSGSLDAEHIVFAPTTSYTLTVPLFLHDLDFGSTIHPDHEPLHARGLDAITRVMSAVHGAHRAAGGAGEYPFALRRLPVGRACQPS